MYGMLGSILSPSVLHCKMIFFIGTQFFHWVPNVVFCKCPFSWANSFREGVTVFCVWNLRLSASIQGIKQQKEAGVLFIMLFQWYPFRLWTPCLVSSASLPQNRLRMDLHRVGLLEWPSEELDKSSPPNQHDSWVQVLLEELS